MDSPKYNRTFHLPWSEGATNDDKISKDISKLLKRDIVITEKMDGSNTSLEANGCFARTHSGSPTHPSFDGLKALHASIKHEIPEGLQLFGEWLFAKHSIAYEKLPNYFMLFNIRSVKNPDQIWFPWDEIELYAEGLSIPTVPILFKGEVRSEEQLKELTQSFMNQQSACGGIREGVVVRVAASFIDSWFSSCVMKCVRKNHVQTSEHWKDQEIIKNKLSQ